MRSASSAVAAGTKAWRPSSSTIRAESASFIWQPKVWTKTFRRGPGAGRGGGAERRAPMVTVSDRRGGK